MKLSDYVVNFLSENLGIKHIFMIVGGANAHLIDSVAKHKDIKYVCAIHEQAAAMAVEGYAKISSGMGAALVTSGPGGTNAITGVAGAWADSLPCIFISGQVVLKDTTDGKTIRQRGVQQINIVDLVKPVTKYAVMLEKADEIRYHLEKAAYLAKNGRPGPVWIDIPTDMQHAEIDPEKIRSFSPEEIEKPQIDNLGEIIPKIMPLLREAKRPVFIVGHGVRLARAEKEFIEVTEKLGFPVVAAWNGADLIAHNHPLNIGRAGVIGQRAANFAVATCDLILAVGSRMDTRQVGNNSKEYAKKAKKIVVDIDRHELEKGLIDIDFPIKSDAKQFLQALLQKFNEEKFEGQNLDWWVAQCHDWHKKYPVVLPEYYKEKKYVNSYVFMDALSDELEKNDIIITECASSMTVSMQAFKIKEGQRIFTSTGMASMGYGFCGTIGGWFASKNLDRIIGIYGDGGFQMNIQELQTVVYHQIPIKIFLLNNRCYLTIKNTQKAFYDGKISASDYDSGYSAPDFVKIANAYGIETEIIYNHENMRGKIRSVINRPGPILCEVRNDPEQELIPLSMYKKVGDKYFGGSLENMYPYMPEDEVKKILSISE